MHLTATLAEIRVLLVEPSPMQAHIASKILDDIGIITVVTCHDGTEALAALSEDDQPTVVISSLYLPDMTGIELVTAMRSDWQLEATPFILVSSETRPQVLDPVRQSGACSIVAKPFTPQQLTRAICAAADYLNPPADLDSAELERMHVLVVDDSTFSRRHMRRLLEELGIERISEAENGRAAVALLQQTMIDLVITDYNMPEMNGHELTEYIRQQSWQNQVPVLMVTSEQNQGRLAAVQQAGVSLICDKPFEPTTIRRVIGEIMNR